MIPKKRSVLQQRINRFGALEAASDFANVSVGSDSVIQAMSAQCPDYLRKMG
jgi:hypothetical protein